jgi:O-methyltransferase involved in polyketide biosynthesis
VIDLRAQFIGDTPRTRLIGCSVLEFEWMDAVQNHSRPCLFTAEGVFPYFVEEDVKRLVCALQERFPLGELVFDALSPLLVWIHNIELALTKVPARLRWGLGNPNALEKWGSGLSLIHQWYYFDQPEARLRGMRLMGYIPLLNHSASILHYRLCGI